MLKKLIFISSLFLCSVAMAEKCPHMQEKSSSAISEKLAKELKTQNCELVPGLRPSAIKAVWESILDKVVKGGKRFDTPPPDGIPTGKIYPSNGKVVFDLHEIPNDDFVKLSVHLESGAELTFNKNAILNGKISLNNLKSKESVCWILMTKNKIYQGNFELPDQANIDQIRDQLLALEKMGFSAEMKKLMQAAIFEQADIDFNRDQLIKEIRDEKR